MVELKANADFVILHQLYGQKKIVVDIDFNVVGITPPSVESIELVLNDSEGKVIDRRKFSIAHPWYNKFQEVLEMKDLSSGKYRIETIVREVNGNVHNSVKELTLELKELEKFKWIDSKEGETSEVLLPWTPIKIDKEGKALKVKVFGRTYYFTDSPFPSKIETKGNSIIYEPIQIIAKVDGRNVVWKWSSFKVEKETPSIVSFTQTATDENLILSAKTQIEYDGMIRVDWRITPENIVNLEELTFEIPIDAKYAKYLYYGYSGGWIRNKPGLVPKDRVIKPFTPVIWLGDDEIGLEWFCESTKDWYNVKPSQRIEILPKNNTVILRMYLVNKPVQLTKGNRVDYGLEVPIMYPEDNVVELSYTFGLQATPVKQIVDDAWDYRIAHHVGNAWGSGATAYSDDRFNMSESTIQKMDEAGVRAVAMHSQWSDFMSYTSTRCSDALKDMVKRYHKHGIKILLYIAPLMSDICPEYPLFWEECLIMPKSEWRMYLRENWMHPQQIPSNVCYNSVWQDFTVDGIAKTMMDEYNIDGVYLDGPASIMYPCSNMLHGCGYINTRGKIVSTYPIFANRKLMRRIYTVIKKRKQDGLFSMHQSGDMTIPVLSYATSYWDGEQLPALAKGESIVEKIPLDAFRAEFMGTQWGVAAEFLGYTFSTNYESWLAISLLHDVPTRPTDTGELPVSLVWKLMDKFGRKQAEWIPYWKNKEYVTVKPEGKDVYVSLYKHPKNGVLAVISNLGKDEAKVKVQLNLEKLGIKRKSSTFEAEYLEHFIWYPISITNGSFDLNLPYSGWNIILITKDAKL